MKALQASGRNAAVKSTAEFGVLSSKPLAGWMLFGRLAGFLLWGIKQLKTLCRLMFWQLQPPGCSGAGRHRVRHTVNTPTHTHIHTHTHISSFDHCFFTIFIRATQSAKYFCLETHTHTHAVGYYCASVSLPETTAVRKALIGSLNDGTCASALPKMVLD